MPHHPAQPAAAAAATSSWASYHHGHFPSPGMVPPEFAPHPQQQQQQQQQQPPLLPGVAWGPGHLRLLQQQPHLAQPGTYAGAQPASSFNSPAGS
ncbi:hypothetical protein HXX76_014589 [Chlamydomonas incerta]|uniref:Uncharacterized protein n=1 Tax=Chlamydomonas incerta TaxID=51695 RepID=A0A835SPE2_CHLIN|nr:hypothetical protein HXX76_014589 [Chlamydomonas incerta]|eukprot:KAG2424380.1 hypothetical protein HXX76_014589 [Chlamydomonas incerta]